jgi:CMP-N,N'-diacetyllegionaminic acid synthase
MSRPSAVALIPARSGSERVPGKNIRPLAGHPLIAYSIAAARDAEVFDRIVVSTDAEDIAAVARRYGAEAPFLRPEALATAVSPDIEWVEHAVAQLHDSFDLFAIVRPTSPFRGAEAIRRAYDQLLATPEADSIRAVEPVRQHPGKMWTIAEDGRTMSPLLDQSGLDVPWHSSQFQTLPPVFVQNAAFELAWTRVVADTRSISGRVVAPFRTQGSEGFNIDYEEDWARAEQLVADGVAMLPVVSYGS